MVLKNTTARKRLPNSDVHIFRVFLDLVMGEQEEEWDPQIRNEDDQWDRYFYHYHLKDNPYRNDDDQDKELEFILNEMWQMEDVWWE